MKIRIAGILLAIALLLPVVLMTAAFADNSEETVVPVETEVVEELQPAAVFYLDGEPLYDVVAQCVDGTYYVTLSSMMALIDEKAVVEQTAEMATLAAELVQVAEVAVEEVPAQMTEAVAESVEAGEEENVEEEPVSEEMTDEEETEEIPGEEAEVSTEESSAEEVPSAQIAVVEAVPAEAAVAEVLDTLTLTAVVGEQYLIANGRYLYAPGGIITLDGAVAVPIRLLAKALNLNVSYDAATGFVNLSSTGAVGYLEDGDTYYNADSLYWLSRIIYSESGNQCLAGKIAVGNVVMNRVNNPNFPDTIYDVIFQKNQFSPAGSGSIYREPRASSVVAAKLVLDGAEVMGDALFFNRVGLKCYASKYRTFVATIGGHSFYA